MGYYTEKAKELKAKQDAELEQLPAARGMEYEYGKYYLDPED